MRRKRTMCLPAFSLIELLVVLLVVAVLIAVLLPTISAVRSRADIARSLSNLRTHTIAFAAYNADHAGLYPRFIPIGWQHVLTISDEPSFNLPIVHYFDTHRLWHHALAPLYYNDSFHAEIFRARPPAQDAAEFSPVYTAYAYPCTFIAAPAFWRNETRRFGPMQLRPTRASDVVFPADKSLIVETWPYIRDAATEPGSASHGRLPVATADASATTIARIDIINGYDRGDGYLFRDFGAVHFADNPPLLHTIDGVRGRDIHTTTR